MSCVHVPVNGYPEPRDAYQQTAIQHCRAQSAAAHVFIGDMNSTSASDPAPNAVRDSKWLVEIEALGWRDAWKMANPETAEYSWYSTAMNGFRVDQAWLSPPLVHRLVGARLEHPCRIAGLSDHSMLIVDVD